MASIFLIYERLADGMEKSSGWKPTKLGELIQTHDEKEKSYGLLFNVNQIEREKITKRIGSGLQLQ